MGFGWVSGGVQAGGGVGMAAEGFSLAWSNVPPPPGWLYLPPSTHYLPKIPIAGVLGLTNPP